MGNDQSYRLNSQPAKLILLREEILVPLATWDMEAVLDFFASFPLRSWAQNLEHQLEIVRPLHGPQQVLPEFFFSLFFYGALCHSGIQLSLLQRIFSTLPPN